MKYIAVTIMLFCYTLGFAQDFPQTKFRTVYSGSYDPSNRKSSSMVIDKSGWTADIQNGDFKILRKNFAVQTTDTFNFRLIPLMEKDIHEIHTTEGTIIEKKMLTDEGLLLFLRYHDNKLIEISFFTNEEKTQFIYFKNPITKIYDMFNKPKIKEKPKYELLFKSTRCTCEI